jgi:transcriptional regulator with XRE-family HTH domain
LIPKPYDFEPQTFGEHLLKRRLLLDLEQKEAGAILGVDGNTVLNWEKGYHEPSIRYIASLISFIGYDPELPNPNSIPEHLKAKRRGYGWTQRAAAKHLGVDACTWSSWENGGTIVRSDHRKMVANFVGLPLNKIHKIMQK